MFQYPLSVKAKESTDFEQYWRMAHCFVFCRIVICTISSCNQCAYALLVVGSTVTCSTAALQHCTHDLSPPAPAPCLLQSWGRLQLTLHWVVISIYQLPCPCHSYPVRAPLSQSCCRWQLILAGDWWCHQLGEWLVLNWVRLWYSLLSMSSQHFNYINHHS